VQNACVVFLAFLKQYEILMCMYVCARIIYCYKIFDLCMTITLKTITTILSIVTIVIYIAKKQNANNSNQHCKTFTASS